ncbi:Cytochrome c1 heme lyase [Batrachochytrium dendrobatidis]
MVEPLDSEQPTCPVDHSNMDKNHPLWEQYTNIHSQTATQKPSLNESDQSTIDTALLRHQLPIDKPTENKQKLANERNDGSAKHNHSVSDQTDAINPLNNMTAPNQTPAPNQTKPLDTDREVSTIPMGGSHSGSNWIYPSEQMFFNAMRRKSWDAKEDDMKVIVPIHNAVNERCWKQILEWESLHSSTCSQPKLLKFQGRPKDYSPKARFRQLLGYKLPFDRHDWTVDRCGTTVTYVVDFYTGQSSSPTDLAFYLDVRPAISYQGIADRLFKFWKTGTGLW